MDSHLHDQAMISTKYFTMHYNDCCTIIGIHVYVHLLLYQY